MARPKKQTVDFFPHYCIHGKSMFILEQKYGNDGYAFWFKLLEMLGCSEGHYLQLENDINWEFLVAKMHFDRDKCLEMINLLATLDAIDRQLWADCKVIWINKFIENIKEAYRNRVVDIPKKPSFLRKKPQKDKDKLRKKSTDEMKLDEMKEDEIKHIVKTKTFDDASEEINLSKYLFEKIRKNNPEHKEPNFQNWAKHIDYMIRLDKRSPARIKELINWCQDDHFWYKNILSTEKLREKFDQLSLAMKGTNHANTREHKRFANERDYSEEERKRIEGNFYA